MKPKEQSEARILAAMSQSRWNWILPVAAKYRDGRLHPAASSGLFGHEARPAGISCGELWLDYLPEVLPESMIKSRAVSVLIKEIVSCAVLAPLMQMLSDPDTWNQLMETYGRTMLQDRKSVRKLRAALDQHASPAPKIAEAVYIS